MSTSKKRRIQNYRTNRIARDLIYLYLKPRPDVPNFEWGIRDTNGEVAIKGKVGTIALLERNQDKLRNLDLSGEIICGPRMGASVVWMGCRFNGAVFKHCRFIGHIFIDCDFTDATLRGAYFFKCEFIRCKFDGLKTTTYYLNARNCLYFCKIDNFKCAKIVQNSRVTSVDFFGTAFTNTQFHPEDVQFFKLERVTMDGVAVKFKQKGHQDSLKILRVKSKLLPPHPAVKPPGSLTFTNQKIE